MLLNKAKAAGALLAGTLAALLCAEAGIRAVGWHAKFIQNRKSAAAARAAGTYRIMCIGESTTFEQYPPFLEKALNDAGQRIKFTVIDRGMTGTTTEAILEMLDANLSKYKPDMVVAMIGINDNSESATEPAQEPFSGLRILRLLYWIQRLNFIPRARAAETLPEHQHNCRIRPEADRDCINKLGVKEKLSIYRTLAKGNSQDAERACIALSDMATARLEYDKALQIAMGCIKRMPTRLLYTKAGQLAVMRQDWPEAERLLNKALAATSFCCAQAHLPMLYEQFSRIYHTLGRKQEEEDVLKKGVMAAPGDIEACQRLAAFYLMNGRPELAIAALEKAMRALPPSHPRAHLIIAMLADIKKDSALRKKAREMETRYYKKTKANYRAIKERLFARGIRLVAVQYPMRPIEQVKTMLGDDTRIIYVDNERLFQKAVARDGYAHYFIDRFAGDFGHCTPSGNKLLGGHIASAILDTM